jgi:hypothetical protein
MNFTPTGTAEQTTTTTSGEDHIKSLLSEDSGGSESTESVAEDTSVADAEAVAEQEEAEHVGVGEEGGSEESEDGSEQATGDEAEESEFTLTEQDSDYSPEAYQRAAEHYSRRAGRTLDPNEPGDRFLLRELMQRGEKISSMQREEAEAEEATAEEAEPAVEDTARQAQPPAKPTIEQVRAMVAGAKNYAKGNIVPEVALDFGNELRNAMVELIWGDKEAKNLPPVAQERANRVAEVLSTYAVMQIADAIPSILQATPSAVIQNHPGFARMAEEAQKGMAADEVLEAKDTKGNLMYPDFERLAQSGTIKKLVNTELREAVFSKDPHKNLVAKYKFAYRLAKNQPVDVSALTKASERGRTQEQERQRRVAAGKLPPGNSNRTGTSTSGSDFMNSLIKLGGSKFHDAVVRSRQK